MKINNIQKNQILNLLEENGFSKNFLNSLKFTDLDTEQIGIELSEGVWLYSQLDEYDEVLQERYYRSEILSFDKLNSIKLQQEAISGYYGSIDEVKSIYGDSWKQIVLECAFEQN